MAHSSTFRERIVLILTTGPDILTRLTQHYSLAARSSAALAEIARYRRRTLCFGSIVLERSRGKGEAHGEPPYPASHYRAGATHARRHDQRRRLASAQLAVHHLEHDGGAGPHR